MPTKRIAVLGYDDVQALDIVGPLDAFEMANRGTHTDRPNYQTLLLGITNRSFRSEAGINFKPNAAMDRVGEIDTLIIPGGRSPRTSEMGSRRRLLFIARGASIMHSHSRRCACVNKAICWVDSDRVCL